MTLIGRIVVRDLVWDEFDREDIDAHNLSQIENVWNVTLANNQNTLTHICNISRI